MRIPFTFFRVGLTLILLGSFWIAVMLYYADKSFDNPLIGASESSSLSVQLDGKGIGFYSISSDSYQNNLIVKILDSNGNYIDIKKITNKVTVNYFRFEHTDKVTLEVTNLSQQPVKISAGIGDTRSTENTVPAVMMLVGSCILLYTGYRKLQCYITAQPDEKSS